MRAVRVEESTAVGAEHFDAFLRSDRSLPDGLCLSRLLKRMNDRVTAEVLRNTLANQQQSVDQRSGQQHPEQSARHIDPEVANGGGLCAFDAANECHRYDDAYGR